MKKPVPFLQLFIRKFNFRRYITVELFESCISKEHFILLFNQTLAWKSNELPWKNLYLFSNYSKEHFDFVATEVFFVLFLCIC